MANYTRTPNGWAPPLDDRVLDALASDQIEDVLEAEIGSMLVLVEATGEVLALRPDVVAWLSKGRAAVEAECDARNLAAFRASKDQLE